MTAPRLINAQVSKYQRDRIHRSRHLRGDVFTLSANLKGALSSGVTVSSVVWRVDNPAAIIFGAASKGSQTVSVVCTAGWGDGACVKAVVTASDGTVWVQGFDIMVYDSPWFSGETGPVQGSYSVSA